MKKKMMALFKRMKIHMKIMLVYGVAIFPILLILCIAVVLILNRVIFYNVRLSVNNNSEVIVNQMEGKTNTMKSCANITLMYLNELQFLRSADTQRLSDLSKHNQVLKRMTYACQVFGDVDGMVFVDRKHMVYGNHVDIEEVWKAGGYEHLLQIMEKHGGEAVWFPMNPENSLSQKKQGLTLTMGKNITDISTGERLGALFLTLEEESLNQLFKSLRLTENSNYSIVTETGTVVSSPNPEEIGKEYLIREKKGEESDREVYESKGQYLYSRRLKELPYYLMFHAPAAELTQDIRSLIVIITGIGFICMLLAVMLAVILAKRITRPIMRLAADMAQVSEGNLSIRCANDTQDETRLIADGFNHMLDTIETLVKNVELEQKKKRKYELALIQSQIKPHFLYNALDTIYVLVHMKRCEDAKLTTKALADFYRVALSSGREIITVGEEIKCVNDYLKIQKIRYAEDFDYRINIPEEILGAPILKMLIQPVVENAIYHGLKEKQEKGALYLYGALHKDCMEIVIEDNGVGMDEEKCLRILKSESRKSFGLKNVNDRIKLYCGEAYGLSIESCQNRGTRVTIRIPADESVIS